MNLTVGEAAGLNAALQGATQSAFRGAWMELALDALDYGVLVIDADGHLELANRTARQCHLGTTLRLASEFGELPTVHASDTREDAALQSALRAGFHGKRSLLGLRGKSGTLLSVALVPLACPSAPCGAMGVTAGISHVLLLCARKQPCAPLTMEFFAQAHGLTPAEAAVLKALCDGDSPSAVARRCGVALSTVRTHISALRHKTGTRSITELVQRVTVLPPIPALFS